MKSYGLTAADARAGMIALRPTIERYARLIVRKGVNVRAGQEVVVNAPVECAEFARLLVAQAYAAGACHVTMLWHDDAVQRLTYENVDAAYFEQVPQWQREQLDSLARDGACFIFVEGTDPEALRGIDPAKPAAAARARNTQCREYRRGLDFNINPWCIAGAPVVAWAQHVFPGVDDEVAVYLLWKAILSTSRADGADPESDWELHDATFDKNLRFLNEHHFDALHYTAENGTDLVIGMTDRHLWAGGRGETPQGHPFFPNMPTEEVFTAPHKDKVNGVVYGTKPYVFNGQLIKGFHVTFKDGKVVEHGAEEGAELLGQLLSTDEGACHIGEVALVPASSPINRSGALFYNTLFDENAACHIAFGASYPGTTRNGTTLSKEELLARGMNQSSIHEDVMIGAEDSKITGKCRDGRTVTLFENGVWVL